MGGAGSDHAFRQKRVDELDRLSPEEALAAPRVPVVFLLENVRSGNNVGSIFRTADAFLLEAVVLVGYTARPPHREILKTSLGAEASVPWSEAATVREAITAYRARGYRVIALEQTTNSTPLRELVPRNYPGILVVLGNEVRGVTPEALALVDEVVEIPQFGTKHSLNVAVAAGVVGWWLAAR